MAKTWVLDTETKGTGAHIAPLERDADSKAPELSFVQLHPPSSGAREDHAQAQSEPRRFRVVDLFSGEVLADGVTASGAVGALARVRKSMDALVYVREASARWRLLSLGETNALWALRERLDAASESSVSSGA